MIKKFILEIIEGIREHKWNIGDIEKNVLILLS